MCRYSKGRWTNYDSLYKLAYKNDNFVSLPYIHDIGNKYVPQIEDITGKNSVFKKHKVIYDKNLQASF